MSWIYMGVTTRLKYAATCLDCGAALEVGARVVYYPAVPVASDPKARRARVSGRDCHAKGGK